MRDAFLPVLIIILGIALIYVSAKGRTRELLAALGAKQ